MYKNQASAISTEYQKVAAWFLGPNGENKDILSSLINKAIESHVYFRNNYYNEIPDITPYITQEIKETTQYKTQINNLIEAQNKLIENLRGCAPFSSWRYQGHMEWDLVLPGIIGYFTAMLYNQNNVATEASPSTSLLEKEAGEQLAKMLGYSKKSWCHITADGTIANLEAMWSARNLRLYPLAIKDALNEIKELSSARESLYVEVYGRIGTPIKEMLLVNMSDWELLNLDAEVILDLAEDIVKICGLMTDEELEKATSYTYYTKLNSYISKCLVQSKGMAAFSKSHPIILDMKVLVPSNDHYSWPKAAGILGLGQNNVIKIPVNNRCQMDVNKLKEELEVCYENKIFVLMVVAVMGSTAEGAVDDLISILNLREAYYKKGMSFNIHCDAAWGGYMRTLMIDPKSDTVQQKLKDQIFAPVISLSPYAQEQLYSIGDADTATTDPHKAGFIPYPAGSLTYKDGRQRFYISNDADYIHSNPDLKMGIFGVEGSKPGAAPASVWMTNKMISLDKYGYGQILGECNYSTKLYYCYWITLADEENDDFDIVSLVSLPDKITGLSMGDLCSESEIKNFIRENIIGKDNETISKNKDALIVLQQIGADVLINSFLVNFKSKGEFNHDIAKMNLLNEELFNLFSITSPQYDWEKSPRYILTSTKQKYEDYESSFKQFCEKWQLDSPQQKSFTFLINTIMQPWPTTPEIINKVMSIFRDGIQKCIEKVID